jgi:epoxyqueuosine reductase
MYGGIKMKKLMLHVCCGPCLLGASLHLRDSYEITCYFYNPNIYPRDEYLRRLEGAKTVALILGYEFIEADFIPSDFSEIAEGLENEPENGARCLKCYELRLSKTAEYARDKSFDLFATTLTTGPRKKASVINLAGIKASRDYDVEFLEGDWKKQDGFKRAMELASEMEIYRQNYCGCEFSGKISL